MKTILAVILLGVAIGCTPTRTYEVSVRNDTPDPVTLWLTKDGPPAEAGWYTTEQFLAAPPDTLSPGIELPPGKIADTRKRKGKFPKGTNAILLIYRTGALAAAPGGSFPLTVRLAPGRNEMSVVEASGKLAVQPMP